MSLVKAPKNQKQQTRSSNSCTPRSGGSRWKTICHMVLSVNRYTRISRSELQYRNQMNQQEKRAERITSRRWIRLICADWIPQFISTSRGCLSLRSEVTLCSLKNLEDSPHRADSPFLLLIAIMQSRFYMDGLTLLAISQTKPISSRAIAAHTLL